MSTNDPHTAEFLDTHLLKDDDQPKFKPVEYLPEEFLREPLENGGGWRSVPNPEHPNYEKHINGEAVTAESPSHASKVPSRPVRTIRNQKSTTGRLDSTFSVDGGGPNVPAGHPSPYGPKGDGRGGR